jgi:glycolate oxidase iron-sulfur subunit
MSQTPAATTDLSWLQRFVLFHIFPYSWRARLLLAPMRILQWTRLDQVLQKIGLFRLLPSRLRQMQEMLPQLKVHYLRMPQTFPPQGKRRARVAQDAEEAA